MPNSIKPIIISITFAISVFAFSHFSEKYIIKEFLLNLSEYTSKREMTPQEFNSYGYDAVSGIIYGEANEAVRLHCIKYFDGSVGANFPGLRTEVDKEICRHLQHSNQT